jgi:hypothetical protein
MDDGIQGGRVEHRAYQLLPVGANGQIGSLLGS